MFACSSRNLACILPIVAAALVARPEVASADPGITLQWNTCAGTASPIDQDWAGPGTYRLVVSAHGFTTPVSAYEVVLALGTGPSFTSCYGYNGAVSPAWQFETGGCDAQRYAVNFVSAQGAPCPEIPLTQTATILDYSPATGSAFIERPLTMAIASHNAAPTDPTRTYLLMTVDFDLSHATVDGDPTPGLCTGADEPACWSILQASYLDPANNELPFALFQTEALWNTPGRTSCPGRCDPARPTTWGAIKAQYR